MAAIGSTMAAMKSSLLLVLVLLTLGCSPGVEAQRARLMPPAALSCDRDHLTSFEGRLERLELGDAYHRAVLRTDWDSMETFELPFEGDEPCYLLDGQVMAPGTWRELLPDPEHPPAGLRVIAWVCEAPATVTLDWRPADPDSHEQKPSPGH